MATRRVNGIPEPEPKHCPHCKRVLEPGHALLTSGMITGRAYICRPCKTIYLPDLKPLARLSGGLN